jgi:hypothetical protein
MPDLVAIYRAFDADQPLAAEDPRYVDLTAVQGGSNIAKKLVQRIKNAGDRPSHHLLMGHTKCGKTTLLNRTAYMLEEAHYATVFFDVAELASRTFEYTTVLLLMAEQVARQLAARDEGILVGDAGGERLLGFLQEKEITTGGKQTGEVGAKGDAKVGWFARWLADVGIGVDVRGGFERSRDITVKVERDARGFLDTINALIEDACRETMAAGYKGLVVICDGCDKLNISATDRQGQSYDLQRALFYDHAADLRSVPCHVIYTVPVSIPLNVADIWESPEFVPAIPVIELPGMPPDHFAQGRRLLAEVVSRRLQQEGCRVDELFPDSDATLQRLIAISGGHISDLLVLVHEAVLEAQTEGEPRLGTAHVNRSIAKRAQEYTRLVESKYLQILVEIDQNKVAPLNSDAYRELIFKRLALEYVFDEESRVDLHPLVAASGAYRRYRNPNAP